jgi:hypothetical protein
MMDSVAARLADSNSCKHTARKQAMQQYRHNHYVPIFYQQRFMLRGQSRYYRLDLQPETISNRGVKYTRKDFHYWGPANVFAQDDLYTTKLRSTENREIEQFFFGQLDTTGPAAINFICNFDHANQNYNEPLFRQFMTYISLGPQELYEQYRNRQ